MTEFFFSIPYRHRAVLLRMVLLVLCLVGTCCNKASNPPVTPNQEPKQTPPPGANPAQPPQSSAQTIAHIQAVDLEGHPLSGLIPIATNQPNAFDAPFSKGTETDANGMGTVVVPANKRSYVRVWDPALRLFANNYLEIQEGESAETETMQVQMVAGSTFELVLLAEDNKPVSNTPVSMMMAHPKAGPWWPGEATTDKDGKIQFGPVPAGKFNILLQTEKMGKAEINQTLLMPGEKCELGPVHLQSTPHQTQ